MTGTAHQGDRGHLLLLVAAAIAALYLVKNSGTTSSGGGSEGVYQGTDSGIGSNAPTIYQIPAAGESFTGFPPATTLDISGLMGLLGGAALPDEGASAPASAGPALAPATNYLDAGDYGLPAPFVSAKKSGSLGNTLLANANPITDPGVSWLTPLFKGIAGISQGAVSWFTGGATQATKKEAVALAATGTDYGNIRAAADAATLDAGRVSGFSDQYVTREDGILTWNDVKGFGLSKDPGSGAVVSYQRDVMIYNPEGVVYDKTTKKGNSLAVADATQGTYTSSQPLTEAQKLKVQGNMEKALPGQTPYNTDGTLKTSYVESKKAAAVAAAAAIANTTYAGLGGSSSTRRNTTSTSSSSGSSSSGSSRSSSTGGRGGFGGGGGGGR